MRAELTSTAVPSRRRRRATRADILLRRVLPAIAAAGALSLMLGLAFAGSPGRIAAGVRVAGVDVGGMTAAEATNLLERRAARLARAPVSFSAHGRVWRIAPQQLGVRADWHAAVEAALGKGDGVGPFRGFRRLDVRLFGTDVAPPAAAYRPALDFELRRIGRELDSPRRDAALRLEGVRPVVVPGRTGSVLDRRAAASTIVRALADLERRPVELPVGVDAPRVTAADLAPVARQVRIALSGPVRLTLGPTRWRLSRWAIRSLLVLPHDGTRRLAIGGRAADGFFGRLSARVDRAPQDADWDVSRTPVTVIPARAGRELDVLGSIRNILRAAVSPTHREARLVVGLAAPKRTTAEAKALGIVGLVGGYSTVYGGDPNRIHNVQLVAHLIDRHLIAPGATFSFNAATGERTAAKGFREAPVIINGEVQTGLGGGVCQVSTTVFNAAYDAGLKITERTNHALYISHYPLARDATVNYPDVDLKFVNDTGHTLLLRTFVGASSLTVGLYGTPVHRKVVSETTPLVETGPPPVKETRDATLPAGTTVVDDYGEPSRSTSVRRRVYSADGRLLYDDLWRSSYRAEPKLVRVGTKQPEKPKAKPARPKPGATGTTSTQTATTPSAPPPH